MWATDVLQSVGNTPLVRLRHMSPVEGVEIWVKLEMLNPSGSIKVPSSLSSLSLSLSVLCRQLFFFFFFFVLLSVLTSLCGWQDRIVQHIVADAEKRGLLKPGGTIVENTSGNTGAAVAMIAAAKGYKAILTMPDKVSHKKERRGLLSFVVCLVLTLLFPF
jgi:cystathionine beta-synthase